MRFIEYFVILSICFTVLLHVASMNNTDICQSRYGDDVVIHTSFKDGTRSCCKSITCDPGFEAVMCRPNEPLSTSCQPCPPNTFQSESTNSVDMQYCDDKQRCPVDMKVEDDDSKVKDRRCLCDLEKGFCNTSKNRSNCQRRYCPAGMELNQDCSCTECLDGFFKDVNGSLPCMPWRNCRDERRQQVAEGTTTTDAECSNKTYDRVGGALPVMTTSTTTKTPSEIISPTSDLQADHSKESSQSSSGLDQTTPQNESSQNLLPVAIATGIIAVLAIVACVCLCIRFKVFKHIYARCKQDRPADQPSPGADVEAPLIIIENRPNGCQNAQHREDLPEREMIVPLTADDTAAAAAAAADDGDVDDDDDDDPAAAAAAADDGDVDDDLPHLDNEIAVVVRQAPVSAEDPHSEMTRAMKQSLQKCRVTLLKNLDVSNIFLSVLEINDTITYEMRELIQIELTSSGKVTKLLDFLLRRPCLSYRTFIFALVCTRQSRLAEHIDAQLAEEYKALDIESDEKIAEIVLSFGKL